MPDVSPGAWSDVLEFYRELIDEHGWRQGPMREFVAWLAATEYARFLHPCRSHEALGLSTVATYEERLRASMVVVVYDGAGGRFLVEYRRGLDSKTARAVVGWPGEPEVFARILGWLGVAPPEDDCLDVSEVPLAPGANPVDRPGVGRTPIPPPPQGSSP